MDNEEKSFEFYMKELDNIITEMENGDIDQLEKLVENFEQGSELIDKCNKILKEAELRIYKVQVLKAERPDATALTRKKENRME